MSTTFPVNTAAFTSGLSPFNWEVSGSSYARTINPGAYFKLNFTGTSFAITVDVSAISGASTPALQYPRIAYSIDGSPLTTYQLASGNTLLTLASSLADTNHSVECYLISSDAYGNRWDGTQSLKITLLTVDTGKTIYASVLRRNGKALFFGDSITEGAWTLLTPNGPTYSNYSIAESSYVSWAKIIADWLGVEYGNCAFGGQGWDSGWVDVPSFPNAWNLLKSGVNRDFTGVNIVFINMGTNGGVSNKTTVTNFLTALRSAIPTSVLIYLIIPFKQVGVTNITAGFNDYKTANPTDNAALIDLGATGEAIADANATDAGIHPNVLGQRFEATLIKASVTYPMGKIPGVPSTRNQAVLT